MRKIVLNYWSAQGREIKGFILIESSDFFDLCVFTRILVLLIKS